MNSQLSTIYRLFVVDVVAEVGSMNKLSRLSGVSRQMIRRFLEDEYSMTVENLDKITNAVGYDTNYVFKKYGVAEAK
ncbi:helix-turn-helix transcriptional regulator [Erysipelothrix sp. HDW6C]|uniref:helix-turn-helix domain-containing protein n=1 Tax=Erysipelothrix sp. HDW6C TaxID=2714930 RepID=UPI00140843C9|nr:helix-turn-helix transcriptional regulator [Erysipelothrix sp. HDW6C]QIK70723.1 helix-turn-helix transcriptional regulator [Erysipelothrix sp. HDW6C]